MKTELSNADQRAAWIEGMAREFSKSEVNNLNNGTGEPAWGDPLVRFSNGADPLYQELKEHVGPFHWTPAEIFRQTFPDIAVGPEELTVISWVLPHTEATKADNRRETRLPSERWARARIFGQKFNEVLRAHVTGALTGKGYPALAPLESPLWGMRMSEKYGIASTWSERHIAYVSGHGTFGLCDGLITPAGKAMVVGSVVARIDIPASGRPYSDHHAYCLFYSEGICGKCIERCPAQAISAAIPTGRWPLPLSSSTPRWHTAQWCCTCRRRASSKRAIWPCVRAGGTTTGS